MHEDPGRIADYLIAEHGADGALAALRDFIAASHADGDNYRLSVLREVKRNLQSKLEGIGYGQPQRDA